MRCRVCAGLTDLTFLNGGFSYLSFTLYYGADGGRISSSELILIYVSAE